MVRYTNTILRDSLPSLTSTASSIINAKHIIVPTDRYLVPASTHDVPEEPHHVPRFTTSSPPGRFVSSLVHPRRIHPRPPENSQFLPFPSAWTIIFISNSPFFGRLATIYGRSWSYSYSAYLRISATSCALASFRGRLSRTHPILTQKSQYIGPIISQEQFFCGGKYR